MTDSAARATALKLKKKMEMNDERSVAEILANEKILQAQAEEAQIKIERARFDLATAKDAAIRQGFIDAAMIKKTEIEIQMGAESVILQRVARESQEVSTRAVQRLELEELASNRYHRIYHFNQAVGPESVRQCMSQIDKWRRMEAGCEFEIVFSSPGGSVIDGMALFDYIRQARDAGHHVVTSTIGYAASMAGILLQAGAVRRMGRESYLLIHELSFGMQGKMGEAEDDIFFFKKIQKRVCNIFAERSKLSAAEVEKKWKRKDWWIDSEEALKLGFIDEIN